MDTQRLILFIVFSFSLLLLWEAWQKESKPPAQVASMGQSAVPTPSARGDAPAPGARADVPAAATSGAGPRERIRVVTDMVVAEIDTLGGDISYLELLQQKDSRDEAKNIVLLGPEHHYAAQSGLIGAGLPNHRTVFRAHGKEFVLAPGQDRLEVRLEAAAQGVKVTKVVTFHRGSYRIDVAEEIANGTSVPLSTDAYFQLTRDGESPGGDPYMTRTYTGAAVYTERDKFQKVTFEDIAKGKVAYSKTADNGWIAMIQHYFVAALLPPEKAQREYYTRKLGADLYSIGVIVPVGPIAPGATARVDVPLYAGPQDQDHLQSVAPGLQLVVDYGWLTVIAAPLFWVLKLFHGWVGNWGLAIILLTVVIKLIFFPLSAASYRSMAKMKLVTPRLMKLREQYGDDKVKMNQAMMELYKTEKINPLGGCLPILVQIPVFISLYWVLFESVELRHAPFYLWIRDLSAPDPWYVLPTLMMVSMIVQTKMNPTPPDPVQAKVMMIMPLVFGVMFYFFPSGLVLYWFVNNILSILQQWQITRMIGGGKTAAGARR
ncbi:MAG TPA: membrane protein insertase YidC [Burkholderiales bacterium]|nr:membrane protein insertase YidC [Burkholderiales bacterium]HYA47482.1 membrane protein insertase YidC [Burkholderiales bacterium]